MGVSRAAARHGAKQIAEDASKLEQEKSAMKHRVDGWFEEHDRDGNSVLDKDELKALLEDVSGSPPNDKVMQTAWASAELAADSSTMGVKREAIAEVVTRVMAYMKQHETIDPMFDKFDVDGNGTLDRQELKSLLVKVAKGKGLTADKVTDADVNMVLKMSDVNGTNVIERDEVLYACAQWTNLVVGRPDPPQEEKTSSVCGIL